jgi:hypothetical protein
MVALGVFHRQDDGPSIKLMAMQGVPWTKAWGAMFLFAFLVSEAAALFARRSSTPSIYSSLPGIHNSAAQLATKWHVARRFESMESWVFYAGSAAHCAVLLWAFFDIWALRGPAYASDRGTPELVSMLLLFVAGNMPFPPPLIILLFGLCMILTEVLQSYHSRGRQWFELLCISFAVVFFLALMGGRCVSK